MSKKELKDKVVEILNIVTLQAWENMSCNEEIERIADQILEVVGEESVKEWSENLERKARKSFEEFKEKTLTEQEILEEIRKMKIVLDWWIPNDIIVTSNKKLVEKLEKLYPKNRG